MKNKRLSKYHQKLIGNDSFLNSQNYVTSYVQRKEIIHRYYLEDVAFINKTLYVLFHILFFSLASLLLPIILLNIILNIFLAFLGFNDNYFLYSFLALVYKRIGRYFIFGKEEKYVFLKKVGKSLTRKNFIVFKNNYEK